MVCSQEPGKTNWSNFILGQAQKILKVNKEHDKPQGLYYSSTKIKPDFFSEKNQAARDKQMTDKEHPFLYRLLKSKIMHQSAVQDKYSNGKDDDKDDTNSLRGPFDKPAELDEDAKSAAKIHHAHVVAKTMCSMLTFASNRRKNAMQLENSITFVACGISDQVNKYLNFIGLSSSCQTAHSALRTLGRKAKKTIKNRMKLGPPLSLNFCPLICIDNLDFQEAVQSTTKAVCSTVPGVLKSQVASVFMTYIAEATDKTPIIPLKPPPIKVLDAQKPDITMLKLMIASDNSSKGVGEVLEGLAQQSGQTPATFASRLMILKGDLGTCLNFSSLKAQRKPNNLPEESLSNIFTLLGGAHTLWNVAQAIISLHFGDSSDSKDLGCWHFFKALGGKSNQVLNKKDFSLMLVQVQKVHKATIAYLILLIMGKQTDAFPKEKLFMKASDIVSIIDSVYEKFISPQALSKAKNPKAPCLTNMLLLLRDFSSIVECSRAMKAGNIRCVLNIWKRWLVMAMGIQGLTSYAIDLPQMYPLLTKYFYNNTGMGTKIDWLKDEYSLAIPVLRALLDSLNKQCGRDHIYQLHKNTILMPSMLGFIKMANQYDICCTSAKSNQTNKKEVVEIFSNGFKVMQLDVKKGSAKMN
ncbi:hypothetical protein PTTG_29630 [Puccinia triticina 1-1 BBBD Race 1]|uniref:DUF6589 domain-containing protein n=1 Tax=Puccinia triticina (isolate 1-1 / race 1 (BBBD)) TaxID=630390 RepID=A0A180G2X1_PUCT1|nr:hypothetical protein PTTG_29630 [Puccinia triticina 1-1 BBBD Race 1]